MKVQVNLDPGSQLIGDYFMIFMILPLHPHKTHYRFETIISVISGFTEKYLGQLLHFCLVLILLLQSNEYINIQNILAPTEPQSSHHYCILL